MEGLVDLQFAVSAESFYHKARLSASCFQFFLAVLGHAALYSPCINEQQRQQHQAEQQSGQGREDKQGDDDEQ